MSYVEKVLQPGEQLRYQATIHWVTYLHGAAWLLAALLVWLVTPASWRDGFLMNTLLIIIVAVGVFFLALAWFNAWITEIAVTDRRVIYKRGLVSRTTAEMTMEKIETVKVDQSILGRILGYGTIHVLGTGQGIEGLRRIARPIAVRNAITAR